MGKGRDWVGSMSGQVGSLYHLSAVFSLRVHRGPWQGLLANCL
jgi:hypothetical protein